MARRFVAIAWPIAGAAAVLWPDTTLSALDGIPLDRAIEAIVLALVLPTLWWLHPQFLRLRLTQAAIVLLLLWKLSAPYLMTQQGWCGRFTVSGPGVADAVPHSWDARADWRDEPPECSAIVGRAFHSRAEFPAWFLNIGDRMPSPATIEFAVTGYVTAPASGTLSFINSAGERDERRVPDGPQRIEIRMSLPESGPWQFEPKWNGQDLWSTALTTVAPPSPFDRVVGRIARVVTPSILIVTAIAWVIAAIRVMRLTAVMSSWVVGASMAMALAGSLQDSGRFAIVLLLAAAVVPVPARLRNVRTTFLLLGVPWLSFFAARSAGQVGDVTFYNPGDDMARYQLFAHRIFMEGRWLEGGSPTLWVQLLYRWLAGGLHVVFGDSSVGELYVDAASMLCGILLAAFFVRRWASFRWGVVAGAGTAITFVLSPIWWLIGAGLAEASAAGFLYLAAFFALRGRRSSIAWTLAASVMAVLAFYSRMNYLPIAIATAVLLLPCAMLAADRVSIAGCLVGGRWRRPAVFIGVFAAGIALLALRTWYYTGAFSIFYGTQYQLVATGLMPSEESTLERVPHILGHVLMSLTSFATFDQPSIGNLRAVLMAGGVIAIILGALRVPRLRSAPFGLIVVGLGGLAAPALVWTGAYPGRASLHFVPFAVAACIGAIVVFTRRDRS